jgi:hypothetical protein
MKFMTTLAPTRQSKGIPIGGQFSAHSRDDATVELSLNSFDTFRPLKADQTKAFIESAFVGIDQAWLDVDEADSDIDDATAGGKAHAYGEIIAFTLTDSINETGTDFEATGERMLNDRREGFLLEQPRHGTYNGPGQLTAVKRQAIVNHCRARADEMFLEAEKDGVSPDVAAHFYGRFEIFSEAALDLSGDSVFYSGD